jgi:hypothetical protein
VLGELFSIRLVPCGHKDLGTQGLLGNCHVMGEGPLDQVLHVGGQLMLTDVLRFYRLGQVEAGIWGSRMEVL